MGAPRGSHGEGKLPGGSHLGESCEQTRCGTTWKQVWQTVRARLKAGGLLRSCWNGQHRRSVGGEDHKDERRGQPGETSEIRSLRHSRPPPHLDVSLPRKFPWAGLEVPCPPHHAAVLCAHSVSGR